MVDIVFFGAVSVEIIITIAYVSPDFRAFIDTQGVERSVEWTGACR
jgi:hypothetical protein